MLHFVSLLPQVPLSEFEFSWAKISDIQGQVRHASTFISACEPELNDVTSVIVDYSG